MKIIDRKDEINRRQAERLIIVETAIYRVSKTRKPKIVAIRP